MNKELMSVGSMMGAAKRNMLRQNYLERYKFREYKSNKRKILLIYSSYWLERMIETFEKQFKSIVELIFTIKKTNYKNYITIETIC